MADFIDRIDGRAGEVQGPVQPDALFVNPPVARRPDGTLLPGSRLAWKDGRRSQLPIESRELVAADIEQQIIADLGGEENVGTVLRQAVRRYSRLSAACEHVEAELAEHGALTKSYAVRRNVDYLIKLNASALAWARVIGTGRIAKDANALDVYMRGQQGE